MLDAAPAAFPPDPESSAAGDALPVSPTRRVLPRRGLPYALLTLLLWVLLIAMTGSALAAFWFPTARLVLCGAFLGAYWAWAGRHLWMHGLRPVATA